MADGGRKLKEVVKGSIEAMRYLKSNNEIVLCSTCFLEPAVRGIFLPKIAQTVTYLTLV